MKPRLFTRSTFKVAGHLTGLPLASPARRIAAFLFDWILLAIPTLVITCLFATLTLWIVEPEGLNAIRILFNNNQDGQQSEFALSNIAPILVKTDALGLPASVKVAVENSNFQEAGELLASYVIDIDIRIGGDPPPVEPNHIRLDIVRLIPKRIRGFAIFSTAALYFIFLTAGVRFCTLGKVVFRIRVLRLDDRPLSYWESFERFGGYLASVGTLGIGLLDLWRDPNRRLAHDKIANTVVIRATKKS